MKVGPMDIDAEFRVIEKADHLIVLCSRETPYKLAKNTDAFLTKAKNILIYAESIEIDGSIVTNPATDSNGSKGTDGSTDDVEGIIKLPGKNLAIVCHNLVVKGDLDVTLDVSGANGGFVGSSATGDGKPGEVGKPSGSVFISVESPTAQLSRLRVRAYGGDGGPGGDTSESGKKGGAGGSGGNAGMFFYKRVQLPKLTTAGKITLLFNSSAHHVRIKLKQELNAADKAKRSWYDRINIAKALASSLKPPVDSTELIDFLAAVGTILDTAAKEESGAELAPRLLKIMREELSTFSKLGEYAELTALLKDPSRHGNLKAQLDEDLLQATDAALRDQWKDLNYDEHQLQESVRKNLSSGAGAGGTGGRSTSDLDARSSRGKPGKPAETHKCRHVSIPGEDADLDLIMPTFFPDQARMLLKRADSQYLAGGKSVETAKSLYERLRDRLHGVPQLIAEKDSSKPVVMTIRDIFEKEVICLTPFSELEGIVNETNARLGCIEAGHDIFDQDSNWAPRLSYAYYELLINKLIKSYKLLTDWLTTYQNRSGQASDQREAVARIRDIVRTEESSVKPRLDAILGTNGPLRAAAYKVRSYEPKMRDQQRHLKEQMANVAEEISLSVNVSKWIDAFTTLASTSDLSSGLKNTLKAGQSIYQSHTLVNDEEGKSIDKKLLIKKINTCGDTLESLTQAISAAGDGSVALEDPGALKVIATQGDINRMLDQFKNILPERIRTEVRKQLDTFLKTVTTRNNAVLEYNKLVLSVRELQSIMKQQATMVEALADHKLQLVDPELPSIVNWLRRSRDDLYLTIMQQLNQASRAIRYWALVEEAPFHNPGLIQGTIELERALVQIRKAFSECLEGFSEYSSFGGTGEQGRFYKMGEEELELLTRGGREDGNGKKVYTVDIALTPESRDMKGIGTNVRISQIRLWLGNAHVDQATDDSNRQILTVILTHTGMETIQNSAAEALTFVHSPVDISFRFHCARVKTFEDITANNVYGKQTIEDEYKTPTASGTNMSAIAPIGPFTTWRVTIREADNPGLNLSRVDKGWLEFWGRSMSSSSSG